MPNQKIGPKIAKNRLQGAARSLGARFSANPIGSPRAHCVFLNRDASSREEAGARGRDLPPTTTAPVQRTARGARHTGERGSACSAVTTTTTMTSTATTTASARGRVACSPRAARAPLSGRHGWRPRLNRARGSSRRRARLAAVVLASRRGDAPAGGSGETRRLKIFSVNDGERRTARGETRRFVGNLINPRVPARTAREGIPPRSMGMEKGPPRARILPRFHAGSRSVTRDARTIVSNPRDPPARARPAHRPREATFARRFKFAPELALPRGTWRRFPRSPPRARADVRPDPGRYTRASRPRTVHPRAARC